MPACLPSDRERDCARFEAESRAPVLSRSTAMGIRECGVDGVRAAAALWRHPPSDSAGLENLLLASTEVLDPRLLAAVTRASTDLSSPPNARAAATIVMGRHVNEHLGAYVSRPTRESVMFWPMPTSGSDERPPRPNNDERERKRIVAGIKRVVRSEPDRTAQAVAILVLFAIGVPRDSLGVSLDSLDWVKYDSAVRHQR